MSFLCEPWRKPGGALQAPEFIFGLTGLDPLCRAASQAAAARSLETYLLVPAGRPGRPPTLTQNIPISHSYC